MIRKYFPWFFSFILVVQFTGVPVIMHFCKMQMQVGAVCPVCQAESKENEEVPDCCNDEIIPDYPVKIASDRSCCFDNIAVTPMKTDIEKLSSENINSSFSNFLEAADTTPITTTAQFSAFTFSGDSSPPPLGESLYLVHSSLLI
jgi:hypothetical protein